MSLSIKNSGSLRQIALALREAPKRIQKAAASEIKAEVAKLIDQGFKSKADPYGTKWRPPQDGGETMVKSGALRRGFVVEIVPGGVGLSLHITNRETYAKWLQRGTANMEARRMVPDGRMPETYQKIFKSAYDRAIASWWASSKR